MIILAITEACITQIRRKETNEGEFVNAWLNNNYCFSVLRVSSALFSGQKTLDLSLKACLLSFKES